MIIKTRDVPNDLKLMRYLHVREGLSEKEKQVFLKIEKGFEGELKFDGLLEQTLCSDWLILEDLLLQWNNTYFQLDTIIIINGKIYVFDVKNYEGATI